MRKDHAARERDPAHIAFGERVREARLAMGWTHKEAADAIGCFRADLVPWEKGRRAPGFDTLLRVAAAFEVSLDWLMTGKGQGKTVLSCPCCRLVQPIAHPCATLN